MTERLSQTPDDEDVPATALSWLREGRRVAVATVVETWGSSPRPAGSQLVVDGDRRFLGSVSGGCVEGAVIHEALDVMAGKGPRTLEFGVSDEDAWAVGLACGGRVRIHVRREDPDGRLLPALVRARGDGVAAVVATRLTTDARALLFPRGGGEPVDEGLHAGEGLEGAAASALAAGRSTTLGEGEDELFLAVHDTPVRVILVGAVHIARPLARMATLLGLEVTVVDPRAAFASEERFPDVRLERRWPGEALADLRPDARTAVVTLTHDPKLDDPALVAALGTDAFYVGALGSRRTHGRRLERLREDGLAEPDLARIHGPVGLDISARTPAEIAVSILAELVACLRGGAPAA